MKFDLQNIEAISIGSHYDSAPDVSRVPPVARRRLGAGARLAFGVSSKVRLDMPVIFSSYAGEINRCLELLAHLQEEVSPTSFSLSVLNAVPAQLAIQDANRSPILALSARASFEAAIISALKFERAYVISYFEGMSEIYGGKESFCLALGAVVVRGGEKFSLDFVPCMGESSGVSELNFLQNLDANEWIYQDGALAWRWRRLKGTDA